MANVLLVDDEPEFREPLERLLAKNGHTVRAAESTQQALTLVEGWTPDILITDWRLNEKIDGVGLVQIVRRIHPHLAVILITGFLMKQLKLAAKDVDVFAFLSKPFMPEELFDLIRRATDKN